MQYLSSFLEIHYKNSIFGIQIIWSESYDLVDYSLKVSTGLYLIGKGRRVIINGVWLWKSFFSSCIVRGIPLTSRKKMIWEQKRKEKKKSKLVKRIEITHKHENKQDNLYTYESI